MKLVGGREQAWEDGGGAGVSVQDDGSPGNGADAPRDQPARPAQ